MPSESQLWCYCHESKGDKKTARGQGGGGGHLVKGLDDSLDLASHGWWW